MEEEEEGLTVFVVNLTFSTKDSGLKKMFRDCGGEQRAGFHAVSLQFFSGEGSGGGMEGM